jgi:hypothetical protein
MMVVVMKPLHTSVNNFTSALIAATIKYEYSHIFVKST